MRLLSTSLRRSMSTRSPFQTSQSTFNKTLLENSFRKSLPYEEEIVQKRLCKEPYNVSHSNAKLVALMSQIQLDLSQGTKNIILAAPHTGSSNMITMTVEALADNLQADVLQIDYHQISNTIDEIKLSSIEPKTNWNLGLKNAFSTAFAPGQFELHDIDDHEHENDLDVDEEEEEIESKGFGGLPFTIPGFGSKSSKLQLNINVVPQPEESNGKTDFVVSNMSISSSRSIEKIKYKEKYPYDNEQSELNIKLYLDYMYDYITSKCYGKNEKLIIYMQDVTDVIEASNNQSGEKLMFGILHLISLLREKSIPVLFIAGCSPSLTDSRNVSKNYEFYSQLIEGNYYSNANGISRQNIAMDGTLFNTSLDHMLDKFEKIELLPPSQTFISLQRAMNPSKTDVLKTNAGLYDRKFKKYLIQLDMDLKRHVAQINFKTIIQVCMKRQIALDIDLAKFASVTNNQEPKHKDALNKLQDLLEPLYAKVWTTDKVNKLVSLAVGQNLNDGGELKISSSNLFQACIAMYETDINRFDNMSAKELDERTATEEPIIEKEETPKNSDFLTADFKRRGIKLNSHEKRLIPTVINPDSITVTLQDIVLPPATKLVLQTLVTLPMLRPDYFSSGILSRSSINGCLFFGPPGTGKTMLAKAIAQCSGAWFMSVSLSDIFDKYVGEGEKNVKAVFSLARKLNGPCVIFLDEVDALFGSRRSDGSGSNRREVLNEFMTEWDGSKNDGIVVLGATNRPFDLDDAILRRMPRRILVDLPDEEARLKVLKVQLTDETLGDTIDLKDLSQRTKNYSGSDLRNVCVAAALARVKESIVQERNTSMSDSQLKKKLNTIDDWGSYLKSAPVDQKEVVLSPLQKSHFEIGLQECPPSLGEETQSLIELRKWDTLYGDGASRNKGKPTGIGFEVQAQSNNK